MSMREFEMHHYRQALMRMRQGDSDRDVAMSRLMGRRAAAALRAPAQGQIWPAVCCRTMRRLPQHWRPRSAPAPRFPGSNREQITGWFNQGVSGVVIHAALKWMGGPLPLPRKSRQRLTNLLSPAGGRGVGENGHGFHCLGDLTHP